MCCVCLPFSKTISITLYECCKMSAPKLVCGSVESVVECKTHQNSGKHCISNVNFIIILYDVAYKNKMPFRFLMWLYVPCLEFQLTDIPDSKMNFFIVIGDEIRVYFQRFHLPLPLPLTHECKKCMCKHWLARAHTLTQTYIVIAPFNLYILTHSSPLALYGTNCCTNIACWQWKTLKC